MFRFTLHRALLKRRLRVAGLFSATTLLAAALFSAAPLRAQTVATYDFEDGTAQGFASFNGASTPVASNAAAYSGSYSLLTTTGANGQGGPNLNVSTVLQAGAKYTITGYVRLASGETATNANFTIRRSDPACSGGTCYDTIGAYQVPVNDSGWAQIGGSYTVTATETALNLYAQLVGPTTAQSFYLDGIVITQTAPPPGGTPVANYTFADGGLDGWSPFGSATLTNAVSPIADPAGNTNSLLVANRTAAYMGPSLSLLSIPNIVAGATYQVSAYILLTAPDASNPTVTLSTKTVDCAATNGAYGNIGTSAPLSSTAWTRVQGTLSFSDTPGAPSSLVLYIPSSSATDSYYVSGVSIGELSPAPLSPSQQDNTGISSNFDDGGLDGWSARIGASVTNSTAAAHSGTGSLLTTGRVANYDGPVIDVSNKMYAGSEYNLSAWVQLQPQDGTTHVINMSLQLTLNGNTSYPTITAYPGVSVPADGQWHLVSVTGFTMPSAYDAGTARLYFQTVPSSGNDLVSFYIDDFQLTYIPPPTIQTNIASIFKTYANFFPIGTTVDSTDLSGVHAQLLTTHFDSITPGNELKWSSIEPSLGTFDFAPGDAYVGLAECNNLLIRGHNLVWATGAQTPAYATGDGTNSPANQALVTANIQEHIQSEVQHFGTHTYAWDVVNEPLDPSQPDCLVHGPFYQVLGPGYLDVAFKAARKYAPAGTELFLNDYSTTDANRLACLVKVVGDLRARGVPIDGVGHEMHNAINYPDPQAIKTTIDTVAHALPGIIQQVTELDMSVYPGGDTTHNYGNNIPPAILAEQGWLYKQFFDVFRHEKKNIQALTFWGMADDDTWLDSFPVVRTNYPLAFDMQLQAKPAYYGIVDPTKLPGYGLHFRLSGKFGEKNIRTLTLTASNGSAGPAYTTQVESLTLRQLTGRRCSPVVTPLTPYPVALGDIPTSGSASTTFTVNFSSCKANAIFAVSVPWSNAVYHTGTFESVLEFDRDKDDNDKDGHDKH